MVMVIRHLQFLRILEVNAIHLCIPVVTNVDIEPFSSIICLVIL
jgi:hypothetical protein